jgi:hypothetical protein
MDSDEEMEIYETIWKIQSLIEDLKEERREKKHLTKKMKVIILLLKEYEDLLIDRCGN